MCLKLSVSLSNSNRKFTEKLLILLKSRSKPSESSKRVSNQRANYESAPNLNTTISV